MVLTLFGENVSNKQQRAKNPFKLPYKPAELQGKPPKIALVGCGGITRHHLQAYKQADYEVVAFCDVDLERAEERRDAFYPEAIATVELAEALEAPGVEIVDITTHPPQRPPLIEAALRAGKHVLSQKPFVLDLAEGKRLADLADECGVLLAVNQNARWAPHFSYLREAVAVGLLGELHALHFNVHWDHGWVEGTPFNHVRHLILYDYAIHWFDLLGCLMQGQRPLRVYASDVRSRSQTAKPPLLGQVAIEYEGAQATLCFDGHSPAAEWATYSAVGSEALLRCEGMGDNHHQPVLMTPTGEWRPELAGQWFDDGFHGAMAELMAAIEQKRNPSHAARQNLEGLAICFAAVESSLSGKPVVPGSAEKLAEV